MSLLDSLNAYGRNFAPRMGEIDERQERLWYEAGADLIRTLLGGLWEKFASGSTPHQRREVLNEITLDAREEMRVVTEPLIQTGRFAKLRLNKWFGKVKSGLFPRVYAGVMALFGTDDLPPIAREATKAEAAKELRKIEQLRAYIINPVLKVFRNGSKHWVGALDGSVMASTKNFGSIPWRIAMNVRRTAMVALGYKEERRVMSQVEEHCSDCPRLAALGWQAIGTLPQIGDSKCRNGCRCYFSFR